MQWLLILLCVLLWDVIGMFVLLWYLDQFNKPTPLHVDSSWPITILFWPVMVIMLIARAVRRRRS